MQPLFSVIIPTFNAHEKLIQTLDSIHAQNFEGVEILVQDGASTDGTRAFLQEQGDVAWRSESDGGIYDAMNHAIERASGRFVMFLGAGDRLENGALDALAAEVRKAGLGAPLIVYGDAFWEARGQRLGGAFSQFDLTTRNVCHQAMVFERALFERLELYSLRYSNCADWAWNIRAWGDADIEKRYVPLLIAHYQGGGQSESREDENFNADILALVQANFSWPVRALYTLRRRAPQGLKNILPRRASDEPVCARAITVSVVIPAYNSGVLLKQTLDSALNQTRAPDEIIVVDDGSTDGTPDWIEANYGERVRLIRQSNGGVARARNVGWRASSGQWIAFLDHDDVWYPDKLERLLDAATPDCGVVYSRWREVDENGQPLPDAAQLTRQSWWHGARGRVFGWLFGWRCPIISMSVPIVRREKLEQIGGFDPRCVPCDDWDGWLRLARVCRFAFVDAETLDYRCYPAQQSRDEIKALRAARRVLGKHPFELAKRPLLFWWWLWLGAFGASLNAYNAAKNAHEGRALAGAVLRAVKSHPLALLAPQWLALIGRRLRG